MKIIGVNISHDTSLAQITDGKIDHVLDEARFRRSKYWSPQAKMDKDNPPQVGMVSIIHKDLTCPDNLIFASFDRRQFELEWADEVKLDRQLQRKMIEFFKEAQFTRERIDEFDQAFPRAIKVLGINEGSSEQDYIIADAVAEQLEATDYDFIPEIHHLYHAECAYKLSPYLEKGEDAVCIVWDGGGAHIDMEKYPNYQEIESIYYCEPDMEPQTKWQRLSNHRALADWGGQHFSSNLHDCLDNYNEEIIDEPDFQVQLTSAPSNGMNFSNMSWALGCDDFGRAAGKVMGMASYGSTQKNVHTRYTVARQLELDSYEWSVGVIRKATEMYPDCKNILLSGGYSLNCTNNYKYLSAFPDHQIFVDPICHDGGTALGAALWLERKLKEESEKVVSVKADVLDSLKPKMKKNYRDVQREMTDLNHDGNEEIAE